MVRSHRSTVLWDGFSMAQNKKKRSLADIDFTALLAELQPQPLNGIATTKYFQIVSVNVKRPDTINTSSKPAFFVDKHHTRIKKATKTTPILVVTESMTNDENTALLDTLSDKFDKNDDLESSMVKAIENASNPDHIVKSAAANPLAFNSAFLLAMTGNGRLIGDLAKLHLINRVMSATYPSKDTTFLTK
ncbi:hypothetical protein Plhal304r1_c061g0148731 [Plasmopara halstedii]